jgi:hypothetical protein
MLLSLVFWFDCASHFWFDCTAACADALARAAAAALTRDAATALLARAAAALLARAAPPPPPPKAAPDNASNPLIRVFKLLIVSYFYCAGFPVFVMAVMRGSAFCIKCLLLLTPKSVGLAYARLGLVVCSLFGVTNGLLFSRCHLVLVLG